VAHGVGAALAPAHAGSLESLGNQPLAARFHRAGTNLPTAGNIAGVVHAVLVIAEVLDLLTIDFTLRCAPAVDLQLLPLRQQGAAPFVLELVTPGGRELRRLGGALGMTGLCQGRNVFAGVKEVEDRFRQREVLAGKVLQSVPRIADGQLLLGSIPAHLRRLTPQRQAELISIP